MDLKNTSSSYGFVSKNFHWIMAAIILFNFTLGYFMGDLDKGPLRFFIFNLHKSLGILVIVLIILRLFWRLINFVPAPLSQNYLLNKLSKFVHYFFYSINCLVDLLNLTNIGYFMLNLVLRFECLIFIRHYQTHKDSPSRNYISFVF